MMKTMTKGMQQSSDAVVEEQLAKLRKEYVQAHRDPFELTAELEPEDAMDVDVEESTGSLAIPQPTLSQIEPEASQQAGSVINPPPALVEEWC